MAIVPPSLPANADFRKRLAITLAALFAYQLGSFIPVHIQGLALDQLGPLFPDGLGSNLPFPVQALGAVRRVSVFALGITPLFTVLLFVEFIKAAFPAFKRWGEATPRNAVSLQRYIFIATLLMVTYQAFALVHALEGVGSHTRAHRPVILDTEYTYATVITLMAGAAAVAWLVSQITFRGLGNGFWVLYASLCVENLPASLFRCTEMIRAGVIDARTVEIGAGFLIAAVAVLVTVDLPWQNGGAKRVQANGFGTNPGLAATIWPPVLAAYLSSILLVLLAVILDRAAFLQWKPYATVAAIALLILLFTGAYTRRSEPESGQTEDMKPVWTMAFAQIAIWIGAELMMAEVRLPFYIDVSSIIVFVAVAVHVLRYTRTCRA